MPIYLQLAGVRGEVDDDGTPNHKGWIELESFSFGALSAKTKDPRVTVQDAYCTRNSDSTSVTLSQLSSSGNPRRAAIDYVDSHGEVYLQIRFEDAVVASHNFSSVVGGPPVETFSLVFTEWKTTFYRSRDSGKQNHPIPGLHGWTPAPS